MVKDTSTAKDVVDVLMITFNAPGYVRLSLPRLLESCDDNTRVWLWHNGQDEETLETVKGFADDPRVYRFHHSVENVRLTAPTNWVWSGSGGGFVSKVDDDCLLPESWIGQLRQAHAGDDRFGALGCARIRPEDLLPESVAVKTETFGSGVEIMRNHWVQGSGYLLKSCWIEKHGLLRDGQSWTAYCMELALAGAINGYPLPFIFEDHMDDPRSEHTLMRSDEDLLWRVPLSLGRQRISTLADWERSMHRSSLEIQRAPVDLRQWQGWRRKVHNLKDRVGQHLRP